MDKKNYRFCAGGLMLLIAAILDILFPLINVMINVIRFPGVQDYIDMQLTNAITTVIGNVIAYAPFVILTIFLLLKKRGTAIMVMSIITLVVSVLSTGLILVSTFAASVTGNATYTINFASPVMILVYALFLALSVSTRKAQNGSFAKAWFLPGIAYCVYIVVYIAYLFVFWSSLMNGLDMMDVLTAIGGALLSHIPTTTLYCIGYFLAGHWLANPWKKGCAPVPPQYQPYSQPQYPYPPYAQSQQPDFDPFQPQQ